MIEALIIFLIQVAVVAAIIYLVLWALGTIGVKLPPRVEQIVWVIFTLLVVLWLLQLVGGIGVVSVPVVSYIL